jgi:hypothetical protein
MRIGLAEQAVKAGLLDAASRAYDIIQQLIHRGLSSLTPEQRDAYIREAVPAFNEMKQPAFPA